MSHPAWVCGLKLLQNRQPLLIRCHTLRGCVDWNVYVMQITVPNVVTPCVGVWIETKDRISLLMPGLCHTLRGCVDWNATTGTGCNKHTSHTLRGCVDWNIDSKGRRLCKGVTPCVGVWIETLLPAGITFKMKSHPAWVCGLKQVGTTFKINVKMSHPAWVCGLKRHDWHRMQQAYKSHTLRGCVDWNSGLPLNFAFIGVTPCVGVWIETIGNGHTLYPFTSHTLRGCVDWNIHKHERTISRIVSHPAWVCGLKQDYQKHFLSLHSHTLRGCVDWNMNQY